MAYRRREKLTQIFSAPYWQWQDKFFPVRPRYPMGVFTIADGFLPASIYMVSTGFVRYHYRRDLVVEIAGCTAGVKAGKLHVELS